MRLTSLFHVGFLSVALTFAVGACAKQKAYHGESLPSDQVATIVGHGVTLHRINGISIASVASGAEVRPGRNEIELSVNSENYNARNIEPQHYTLVLNAQPGSEYAITGRRGDGRLCAWPINPETGDPTFETPAGCITRE